MKIALLNLKYDNNYGGNIQRYALMTVLQRLGHDVTHLNLRFDFCVMTHKEKFQNFLRRIVNCLIRRPQSVSPKLIAQRNYVRSCEVMDRFYNKYIQHTEIIWSDHDLRKHIDYDMFIVGSDQVWRKSIASFYGNIGTYFFDYLPNNSKKIAYGVSMGISDNELDSEEIKYLTPLYQKFAAVSVREDSALQLFKHYGWNKPLAEQVLDPTFLLTRNDYLELINDGSTVTPIGNMFCYILDPSPEKELLIKNYEKAKGLKSFIVGLGIGNQISMQQWLRSFCDSEYVITDSFHGVVFSIIFNKQFKFINNAFRGNARFESLFRLLEISAQDETIDYSKVNARINILREKSIDFLKQNVI